MNQFSLAVAPAFWKRLQTLEMVEGDQMRVTTRNLEKKREDDIIKSI